MKYSYHLERLPWFAWPALPFALWTLWSEGPGGLAQTRRSCCRWSAFVVFLVFLSLLGEGREVSGCRCCCRCRCSPPPCFGKLRRGATNAYYWFAIMLFTFFAWWAWFYWMAIDYGVPARLGAHMMKLQPEYQSRTRTPGDPARVCLHGRLVCALVQRQAQSERPVTIWAAGVTIVWTLVALLLVNYIDTGKTYSSMVAQLVKAMPAQIRLHL